MARIGHWEPRPEGNLLQSLADLLDWN
jgi:hypothetical protein